MEQEAGTSEPRAVSKEQEEGGKTFFPFFRF
jgi:hypothetical protein